mgnify:CR=1 FL=1
MTVSSLARVRSLLSFATFAVLAAISLPGAAHARVADAFQQQHYRSGDRNVVVDVHARILGVKAPTGTDPGAISLAVDDVVEQHVKDTHVLSTLPLRSADSSDFTFFAVTLDADVDSATLGRIAEALPASMQAYPALRRETGRAFAFDELIVTAAPGQLAHVLGPVLDKTGGQLVRYSRVPHTALVRVGAVVDHNAVRASAVVGAMPGLVSAEPNLVREYALNSVDVDDPMRTQQWHLSRDGVEGVPGVGQAYAKDAWAVTMGSSDVVVAVFDTGTDMDHPDLVDNIVGGFDAVGGDDDPDAECSGSPDGADYAPSCPDNAPFRESHGTAVSGTVAAVGNNGIGVAGVCPGCKLMPVRFIGGGAGSSMTTADAFIRAIDDGADIINNSWGPGASVYFPLAQAERDAFEYARVRGRDGRGAPILFAAGNETVDVILDAYAATHLTIAVSASTNLDDFALYSNYGAQIDVAAPSQGGTIEADNYGIVTADFVGEEGYSTTDYAPAFGGTSAACPVAAGVAGLVLSQYPDLTSEQLRLALTGSADKITATQVPWIDVVGQDLAEAFAYDDNGHSRGFGYGRVNAAAALELAGRIGNQGEVCTPGADDNVCSNCSDAGRCQMPCAKTEHCLSGSICEDGYCTMPLPNPGDLGEECSADCDYCVAATDTRFESTSICTQTCTDDDPCPAGFSCRRLEAGGLGVCAVGSDTIGYPGDSWTCFSSVVFASVVVHGSDGQPYCSDVCFDDGPGACPYGFHCGGGDCECTAERNGRCFEYTCQETSGPSDFPLCLPNEDHGVTCGHDDDCPVTDYCAGLDSVDDDVNVLAERPGECRPDDREGCDICNICYSQDDCSDGSLCWARRNSEYGHCIRYCGTNDDCPGDSECVEVDSGGGGTSFMCASPERPDNELACVDNWTCSVEECRDDIPCDEGQVCEDNVCVDAPNEPNPTAEPGTLPPLGADPAGPCSCDASNEQQLPLSLLGMLAFGLVVARRRRR